MQINILRISNGYVVFEDAPTRGTTREYDDWMYAETPEQVGAVVQSMLYHEMMQSTDANGRAGQHIPATSGPKWPSMPPAFEERT